MKRLFALILALAMCFSLAACNNKPDPAPDNDPPVSNEGNNPVQDPEQSGGEQAPTDTPDEPEQPSEPIALELDTLYEVKDYAELTLVRIATTDKVEASMAGSIYYENGNDGETYVDVVFDIVNKAAEAVESDEFMTAVAVSDSGNEYPCKLYCIETNDMTYVEAYEDISPLSKVRFHAAITVPVTETKLTLKFNVGSAVFTCEYDMGVDLKNTIALVDGDIIGNEDYATAEFMGYEFTDVVYPSNTNGYYRYYQVDSTDNTYLAVKFKVTNYQANAKDIDTFISGKATFAGKYKYAGFVISEDDDGKGLSSYNDIAPLGSAIMYCLIEVPKTVMEQDFSVSIMFNKTEYSIAPIAK